MAHGVAFAGLGEAREPRPEPRVPPPDAATPAEVRRAPPRCMILKSAERAKAELGIDKLPPHVAAFGRWMIEQAGRDLGVRDVVKAYVITQASIQRAAIGAAALRVSWPAHPFGEQKKIRPEDTFARLLLTPAGRRYLDAAEGGVFDAAAARQLTDLFRVHSRAASQLKSMERAVELGAKVPELARILRAGTTTEWAAFAKDHVYGIGPAKTGFFASLLGRGDIPTADAREIQVWWSNFERYSGNTAQIRKFAGKLAQRLQDLKIDMPLELRPFYQHLAHHAVWDAVGRSETTHADVTSCMRLAGLGRAR